MSTATNGKPTAEEAPVDGYVAAQRADYAENERKAIDARTWRRAFSGAGVALLLSLTGNVVLANRYTHDVFVYDRTPQGLVAAGPAAEELTPQQFDIQAQLGAWIRAYRDVPGDDKMVDRNIRLLEATTADFGADHALSDLKTWQSQNNPKLERKDFTRTVDPTVDALHQPGTDTWNLSWIEYVTNRNGTQQMPTLHHGVVVLLPNPRLPVDNPGVNLNPAGVTVVHYELR